MTQFLDRRTQLDLRLTKELRLASRARLQPMLDIYHVLNAGTALAVNNTYGPAWQRPVSDNAIGGVDLRSNSIHAMSVALAPVRSRALIRTAHALFGAKARNRRGLST